MKICEATTLRIQELSGKSKNPGIVNIEKIAEGLGVTIREFYDSEIFDNLDPED